MKANYKSIVLAMSAIVVLVSCATDKVSTPLPASDQIAEIEEIMEKMFEISTNSNMRAQSDSIMEVLNERYDRFVKENPEHEMAPVYLDNAANIARKKKDYKTALEYYNRIVKDYPQSENIVDTKFLIAFVYDAELNNKEKAREQYQAVVDEYPNHILGRNAKARLENLHMSDEELIEHFESMNK